VVAALVVGFATGFGVSRATGEDPTFEDAVAELQADAGTTADALELVGLHYAASREAARGQLGRARESFADVEPDLRMLAPGDAADAAQAIAQVEALVERNAPARDVEQAAEAARAAVRRAARLR